ncbi:rhodanese-related sulfurtransferase [Thermovibrio guaymasensis]|uniref:Rhodanese-related sulfurtransferase n=1 Tax=Thermovibrio guaymasensis TaxID=240167 RepID=A0A420W5W4_9BACT|nr:rhodanese-like domain-containing protein [Thermovibrio guaymasensis]RKQ60555.1 rhodanese-related sulfurtransferase [Thermovibrio guaymasensis]
MGLKEKIREMNLDWLTQNNHKISLEAFIEKWKAGEAVLLDVRTDEEAKFYTLEAFGIRIPLNQLPDRLNEIPKDKLVCPICPGKIRATIAYSLLINAGFNNVKVLASSPSELIDYLKPGVVKKLSE